MTVVVDLSQTCTSVLFAATHGVVDEEQLHPAIINVIRSLNVRFRDRYGELILAADSAKSWRRDAFSFYKASRVKDKKESATDWRGFHLLVNRIKQEIRDYQVFRVVEVDGLEGDDVIATVARKNAEILEPTLILSADKDFIQLHTLQGVEQYDTIGDRWIRSDNPKRFLFEQVIRGDRADGVPNIFSDDDTFVVEDKRQKKVMSKDIEKWWNGEDLDVLRSAPFLARNRKMISLDSAPKELTQKVVDQLAAPITPRVFDYVSHVCGREMMTKIEDFTQ